MSIHNGNVSSSITHTYILTPLKTGSFKIPSFSVEYNGKKYTSVPISIQVLKNASTGTPKQLIKELEDHIFIVMEPEKSEAYNIKKLLEESLIT
jgi:hypothetical protein